LADPISVASATGEADENQEERRGNSGRSTRAGRPKPIMQAWQDLETDQSQEARAAK
jgi:hypothetical protein